MNKQKEKNTVSLLNLSGNIFLFLIKISIGALTGSFALIADSLNSLSDIFSSSIALIAVKISSKKPDGSHPFGHERIESITGLIIGILVVVIGIELIKESLLKIIFGNEMRLGILAVIVLVINITLKLVLAFFTKKSADKTKSIALFAIAEDSKADVVISFTALIGVIGAIKGYLILDPLMGLAIAFFVIWNGIKIGIKSSNQLIGKSPSKEIIEKIKSKAMEIKGVKGIHDIKAQQLGALIQVEIHIVLDENLSIQKAHSIGKNVQYAVESMEEIDRVFIHLDPFKINYFWNNEKQEKRKKQQSTNQ